MRCTEYASYDNFRLYEKSHMWIVFAARTAVEEVATITTSTSTSTSTKGGTGVPCMSKNKRKQRSGSAPRLYKNVLQRCSRKMTTHVIIVALGKIQFCLPHPFSTHLPPTIQPPHVDVLAATLSMTQE